MPTKAPKRKQGRPRKFTDEELIALIGPANEHGGGIAWIAKKLGVTEPAIHWRIREKGIKLPEAIHNPKQHQFNNDVLKTFRAFKGKENATSLGYRFNVNSTAILYRLKKAILAHDFAPFPRPQRPIEVRMYHALKTNPSLSALDVAKRINAAGVKQVERYMERMDRDDRTKSIVQKICSSR